jgi:hypothetical protein
MKWLDIGLKLLPYVLGCVRAVEGFFAGPERGKEKEDAAVGMVHAILQTVEAGIDRDLLNNTDVNVAVRKVMQALVALENVVASARATDRT